MKKNNPRPHPHPEPPAAVVNNPHPEPPAAVVNNPHPLQFSFFIFKVLLYLVGKVFKYFILPFVTPIVIVLGAYMISSSLIRKVITSRGISTEIVDWTFDKFDNAICSVSGSKCPKEDSALHNFINGMASSEMEKVLQLSTTVSGAKSLINDHVTMLGSFGTDPDWEKFLGKARKLSQAYKKVEDSSFKTILKTRSFCELSRDSIETILEHIDNDEMNEVLIEVQHIQSRISETIDSFDSTMNQLEQTYEQSNDLVDDAVRMSQKHVSREDELVKKGKNGWVHSLLTAASVSACLASGPLAALCVGAVGFQVGGAVLNNHLNNLTEEEIEHARVQIKKYQLSRDIILTAREALDAYRNKLEEFRHSVENAGKSVDDLRSSINGQRDKLKKKAKASKDSFENIIRKLTQHIDRKTDASAHLRIESD